MKIRFGLLAITMMALTACGGSDDGANASSAPTLNNSGFGTGLSSKDSTKPTPSTTINTSIQGVIAGVNRNGTSNISATTATSDISKVVIGDTTYELGSNLLTGSQFVNVRYGYLKDATVLFAQGAVASNVPSTGRASYQGSAVHVASGQARVAPASFVADFDKKTLVGTVRVANGVNLGANISGNRFSGTIDGVSTTGYFYGENANELGGLYTNSDGTISGAYAAKK